MNALLMPHSLFTMESTRVEMPEAPVECRPVVYYFPAFETWRLVEPFELEHKGSTIRINAPFDFDMASIPRIVWSVKACHELGILAPLVHDLFYRAGGNVPVHIANVSPHRTFDRGRVDRLFRHHMEQEGVSRFWRNAAYSAVRLFGRGSWKG